MRSAICSTLIDAQRHGHAAFAAELVDKDFMSGMAFNIFKQQRGAAGRVFAASRLLSRVRSNLGNAIGDLGDFQLRRNFFADALQFALLLESLNPVTQIFVGQCRAPRLAIES